VFGCENKVKTPELPPTEQVEVETPDLPTIEQAEVVVSESPVVEQVEVEMPQLSSIKQAETETLELSPEDQEKADELLADHGKKVIVYFQNNALANTGEDNIINYLKYFISKGADVNATDTRGQTSLYSTRWWRRTKVLEFLISQGADVNGKTDSGWTPLHAMVSASNNEAFRVASDGTRTPMAGPSYLETIRFLVSQGADVNVKDNRGQTPLDVAKKSNKTEIVEYLSSIK